MQRGEQVDWEAEASRLTGDRRKILSSLHQPILLRERDPAAIGAYLRQLSPEDLKSGWGLGDRLRLAQLLPDSPEKSLIASAARRQIYVARLKALTQASPYSARQVIQLSQELGETNGYTSSGSDQVLAGIDNELRRARELRVIRQPPESAKDWAAVLFQRRRQLIAAENPDHGDQWGTSDPRRLPPRQKGRSQGRPPPFPRGRQQRSGRRPRPGAAGQARKRQGLKRVRHPGPKRRPNAPARLDLLRGRLVQCRPAPGGSRHRHAPARRAPLPAPAGLACLLLAAGAGALPRSGPPALYRESLEPLLTPADGLTGGRGRPPSCSTRPSTGWPPAAPTTGPLHRVEKAGARPVRIAASFLPATQKIHLALARSRAAGGAWQEDGFSLDQGGSEAIGELAVSFPGSPPAASPRRCSWWKSLCCRSPANSPPSSPSTANGRPASPVRWSSRRRRSPAGWPR